jgi:hypothetical protein
MNTTYVQMIGYLVQTKTGMILDSGIVAMLEKMTCLDPFIDRVRCRVLDENDMNTRLAN